MTWIRVDTTLPREVVIGEMCERFDIDIPAAVGHWIGLQLGFADHRDDGMVLSISRDGEAPLVAAASLEQWAGWRGERGAFAHFIRERGVERRTGEKDPPGRLLGWWRQEAWMVRQARDRMKRIAETPKEPPRNPQDFMGGNLGETEQDKTRHNDTKEIKSSAARVINAAEDPVAQRVGYAIACTTAANRGLARNPAFAGHSFNELASSAQDAHLAWLEAGVPLPLATLTIQDIAALYKPRGRSKQPSSLAYFSAAVLEAWEREQTRAGIVPATGAALTEAERYARSLEAEAGDA